MPFFAFFDRTGRPAPVLLTGGLTVALLSAVFPAALFSQSAAGQIDFFEKKIRPVLAEQCYACHSAKTAAMGELRLDTKAALLEGGSRGPAIVPGSPEGSLLLKAVSYRDVDLKMPPSGKLNEQQIADLSEWIRIGAPDPRAEDAGGAAPPATMDIEQGRRFWSFQPIQDHAPPAVNDEGWARTGIDNFILHRLEQEGLEPARPAGKRTLLRRVTFDLIGLPPTPKEVEDFLADDSPEAYARVVERLLASPHYGERWARHWLDLVRYAETNGHEFDNDKLDAWRYRDYVIRAFNDDLPYDQFMREQIAGDLLADPRLTADGASFAAAVGTGFYWFGEVLNSATDSEKARADQVDNQIDVMGKTFLGLTVACARCHDHKFDPIPTADYYALAGVMHSTDIREVVIDSPGRATEISAIADKIVTVNEEISELLEAVPDLLAARLAADLMAAAELLLSEDSSLGGDATRQARAEQLGHALEDPAHPFHPFIRIAQTIARGEAAGFVSAAEKVRAAISAQRAEDAGERGDIEFEDFEKPGFAGWSLSGQAFGGDARHRTAPNLPLAEYRGEGVADSYRDGSDGFVGSMTSRKFRMPKRWLHVRLAGREGKLDRSGYADVRLTLVADGYKSRSFVPTAGGRFEWQSAAMTTQFERLCYFELVDRDRQGHIVVDRIVISDSQEPPPDGKLDDGVEALLDRPDIRSLDGLASAYQRLFESATQQAQSGRDAGRLPAALRPTTTAEESAGLLPESAQRKLRKLQDTRGRLEESIPASAFAMSSQDEAPHDIRIHVRGNHKNLGEEVQRGFLGVISSAAVERGASGSGRFQIAAELTRSDNPLPARVMVNRIWQHHFGEGIVRSPDNFGKTGERPTHPEVLDYLARQFIGSGWSVKAMQRLMVLSSTYRMSSAPSAEARSADPGNRLLQHMPVRRLEAEVIRDALLAVSGSLDRTLYGPSVMPHISEHQDGRGKPSQPGPLDGDRRRSLYVSVRRNFLTPLLLAFDYPLPTSTIGRRNTSTVPSQALMMMNNEFVAFEARRWADAVLGEKTDPRQRIAEMFVRAYGRQPEARETDQALTFLAEQAGRYDGAGTGDPRAWADLAHVLLNGAEFIFIP
ncbi:MAG: PSD1 and planctomycete cytochrome C domain-containing protein [Acidobacteria bacterium]|nr:PSD1 and planctomycete cytochrome C domain-containing protein [Acidobacteriota bacterium]